MSEILNVTPREFAEIHERAQVLSRSDFSRFMRLHFECEMRRSYRIVVRRVPSIPRMMLGIHRIGPDRDAWGGILA